MTKLVTINYKKSLIVLGAISLKSVSLVLFFTASAQAKIFISSPEVLNVDSSKAPQFCKISIVTGTGESRVCSGTRISPFSVLTARHCIPSKLSSHSDLMITECGSDSFDDFSRVVVAPSVHSVNAADDLALIHLKFKSVPLETPTLKLAKYPSMYLEAGRVLKKGVQCQIFGFGKSSKPELTGKLQMMRLNSQHLLSLTSEGFLQLAQLGDSTVMPGDSGGALVCQVGKMAPELLGVTSSNGVDSKSKTILWNRFTPVFTDSNLKFIESNVLH